MRKPGAVLLAAPVAVGELVERLLVRSRTGGIAAIAATIALLVAVVSPTPGNAIPATEPALVSADLFVPIGTAHDPADPFTVTFDRPMDRASVAAELRLDPPTAFSLDWNAGGTRATLKPDHHWRLDTLYQVVVGTNAHSAEGGSLAAPLRSVVLTGAGGTATITPTMATLSAVRLDSAFRIRLDRAVPVAAVRAALRSDPPLSGDLVAEPTPGSYRFQPSATLRPDTRYALWLEGLVDANGVPFGVAAPSEITTIEAPSVAGVRPKNGARRVARDTAITIRFSQRMDAGVTERALRVTANGKAVKGSVRWSTDGTRLTFTPKKRLGYDAKVVVRVDDSARSAAGAPISRAAKSTFRTKPRPADPTVDIPTGGGGAASGSWAAVEAYYLRLMNCTRTGGWVTGSGACSSPGGRDVAALTLSSAISSKVARPYARLLATRNACSHFIGGNPGDRLRAAGFGGYNWGENIGCRSAGSPFASVLGTHLFYQSEKPYNGGHYRNLMNPSFRRVGIGVWVAGGRVRLVIDFYGN
ncbi:MAG TPA: Ig-like domain-containing protein [Candidatus Limnocylindrales bacterium]|nr:Ig-like domain-containing protein [Candidatus Limnocylindrales bacterium]